MRNKDLLIGMIVDGRRILKGFGMLGTFQMSSLSGAEDGVGHDDVSPYFITNAHV
jgi:hypothetical protein